MNGPHKGLAEYDDFTGDLDLVAIGGTFARNIFIIDAGGGALKVKFEDGTTAILTGLVSGTYVEPSPTNFSKVFDADTDVVKIRVGW
jgi:hypothetical protein